MRLPPGAKALNAAAARHTPGPLSAAEVDALDATLLPARERHHLRLLAHALRSLQQIQQQHGLTDLPDRATTSQWLLQQPGSDGDQGFAALLASQLDNAGHELQQLAHDLGRTGLSLELDDLIAWARRQADQRLARPAPCDHQPITPPAAAMRIDDAISFFRQSCGRWHSQRSSHHLLHRRAEAGGSLIVVDPLEANDAALAAIAVLHQQDPARLVGGCRVRWSGSMAWDKAGETHEGESVFGLIPTDERGRAGLLLRDRGYAETAPVAGEFSMDERDALLLTTAYETMSSLERFSFAGPDVRLRTSTVEGLSNTASFCVETRVSANDEPVAQAAPKPTTSAAPLSALGW